jgi:hypothetical protein
MDGSNRLGPEDDTSTAWLAAYAVGLAASHDPTSARRPCARELAATARGDVPLLLAARDRILGLAGLDEELRRSAMSLLARAAHAPAPDRSEGPSHAGGGLPWSPGGRDSPWPGTIDRPTEPDPCGP